MRCYEVMEDYISEISSLQDDIKEAYNDEERKFLQSEQDQIKAEMVEALRALDKE